jgi:hypothetical protein
MTTRKNKTWTAVGKKSGMDVLGATIVLHRVAELSLDARENLAKWLVEKGIDLMRDGGNYDKRFTGRFYWRGGFKFQISEFNAENLRLKNARLKAELRTKISCAQPAGAGHQAPAGMGESAAKSVGGKFTTKDTKNTNS